MKILMIAPQPFFSPRGTPLSVYYRAHMLARLGHEIDLLTYPLGKEVEIEHVNIIRGPAIPFIYEVKIGPSVAKLLLDVALFFKAVSLLLRNDYDVIHAHEEAVFFCILFRFLFRIDYVYDMHSSLPQQLVNFSFTTFKPIIKIFSLLEKHAIAGATAVITICDDLAVQVGKYQYKGRHELIQNTLFFPIILADEEGNVSLRQLLNLRGKKIVLYAGSFEPYQGLDMYLESIRIVMREREDVFFIFLGGHADQVLSMRQEIENRDLSDVTLVTGMLETNLVRYFLKEAEVVVSPRLKGTNTPLKIYEYMASGIPIVATNLRTHTQELDDSCAFLTLPEPNDFGKGILDCLGNPLKASERAQTAYARYNKKYGDSIYEKKLQRAFEPMIKKKANV